MKRFVSLFLISICFSCQPETVSIPTEYLVNGIEMHTLYANNWDKWVFQLGDTTIQIRTEYVNDWDDWTFTTSGLTGRIEKTYEEEWNSWKLKTDNYEMRLSLKYLQNWKIWEIDDFTNKWHADLSIPYHDDWGLWHAHFNSQTIHINTNYSNNYNHWKVDGNFPMDVPLEYRISILYIPVIVNSLIEQGIL